jgi:hypothetical protein
VVMDRGSTSYHADKSSFSEAADSSLIRFRPEAVCLGKNRRC